MRRSRFKPDLYVTYRILKILKDHGPLSKTSLALYARLNYQRVLDYLRYLNEVGIVKIDREVTLTPQGLEVLRKIEEVLENLGLR